MASDRRLSHVFVCAGYPPARGYFAHRAIIRMQDHLCTRVISIRAASHRRLSSREYSVDGIEVLEVPFPVIPRFNKNLALVRAAAQLTFRKVKGLLGKADLVECGSLYTAGEVARVWLERSGNNSAARVSDAIGDDVKIDLARLPLDQRDRLISSYDAILCNSRDMAEQIRAMEVQGCPPVFEAFRGVDFGEFNTGVPPSGPFGPDMFPRFLYLGGFPRNIEKDGPTEVKGGLFLLSAWRAFETLSCRGVLVLGGPGSDCRFVRSWRESLMDPGRVFVAGKIPPEKVAGIIRGSDVVVIPSLSEGLPNLANEAQACGVPVLGTDAGGIPETVDDGRSGIIVPRGSVAGLVSGLFFFSRMGRKEASSMGLYAASRMKGLFTWDGYRRTALEAYRTSLVQRGFQPSF